MSELTGADGVGRVHQIAQRAIDLERAVEFYRDRLRLRHVATFDPPGLAFFDLGNTRLILEEGTSSAVLCNAITHTQGPYPRHSPRRTARCRAPGSSVTRSCVS